MTPYELVYSMMTPFLPVLYGKVRRDVRSLMSESAGTRPRVLDVGGRKSPYSVGLPADIIILDIPRESEVQRVLNLGLTDEIHRELSQRRSNITEVILQDMTRSTLPSDTFDGILCVEVIEHVVEDDAFIRQTARVLKPGGWLYLTTHTGDNIRNVPPQYNPDQVTQFRRDALRDLLSRHYDEVAVTWGVKTGPHRVRGMASFSPRHPLTTAKAMAGNLINRWESRGLDEQPSRTAHLFAIARKEK